MANVQGKCCLLVKCQLQFTPCKHVTQVNWLCRFSQYLLYSKLSFETVSDLSCLLPPFWLSLESGNYRSGLKPSQGVIRKAKTCRPAPIAHWHLGFPLPRGGLWIHWALVSGLWVSELESPGRWGLANPRGALISPAQVPMFFVVTGGGSPCHVWLWCGSVVMFLYSDLKCWP